MAIYDCFTFYNEFELLEIRMNLLEDVVDYFVIVEADKTTRGQAKEYNFEKRKAEFSRWENKIIYVKADNAPDCSGRGDFTVEIFQRNHIVDGLKGCAPDDLIMISDVDEIPRPELIQNLYDMKVTFTRKRNKGLLKRVWHSIPQILHPGRFFQRVRDVIQDMPVVLEMDVYYYYLNCKSRGVIWTTAIMYYKTLCQKTPQYWREQREGLPKIRQAGWHFSYLGGKQKIKEKLHSIVEGDESLDSDEYIEKCLSQGKDLYGRKGKEFEYEFIDEAEIHLSGIHDFIEKYPYLYRKV